MHEAGKLLDKRAALGEARSHALASVDSGAASLEKYEAAVAACDAIARDAESTIDEVLGARAVAATLETWTRKRDLSREAETAATAARIRCERRVGAELAKGDGRAPAHRPGKPTSGGGLLPTLSNLGVSYNQSSLWQQEAALPDADFEAAVEEAKAGGRKLSSKAVREHPANPTAKPKARDTGAVDWYTPPEIVEAAREVLGGIDLDPASCPEANEWIRADRIYTKEDDGLAHQWSGRVWLNPPYRKGLIDRFVDHLLEQDVRAVVLSNNATETGWGQKLLGAANAVCFLAGRVHFIKPGGETRGAPTQGQMVCGLGVDRQRFEAAFGDRGQVWIK